MTWRPWATLLAGGLALASCDWMPGKPNPDSDWAPPSANLDFKKLYAMNCVACHSDGANLAPGRPMNDPVYLAIISRDELRAVIAQGVPGTNMPGFGPEAGGGLTDAQVDVLTEGILSWRDPAKAPPPPTPPYSAPLWNVAAGADAYAVFCASCHGADGKGGPDGGSVVDPAYLGLVSEQALRTAVIAGRPDLGMPDWRNYVPGRAMTDEEIADVTAWLVAQRPNPNASTVSTHEPSNLVQVP